MATYIAFEGGEGSGKSTQASRLAARLDAVLTREPGATPLGAELRRLLLGADSAPVGSRAETLLMAADRAQHLDEIVRPALVAGRHVVSDRSAYSSLAYQGAGRGLGIEAVRSISDWAVDGRWPDVVVWLKIDPEQARGRLGAERDRLEQEADDFHQRVDNGFEELAAAEPDRWVTIDASGDPDQVEARVWEQIAQRLDQAGS